MQPTAQPPSSPWHAEYARLQTTIDRYSKQSLSGIQRLRIWEQKAKSSNMRLYYLDLIDLERKKQAKRRAGFIEWSQKTSFNQQLELALEQKIRLGEFIEWLEGKIEEMENVGLEVEEDD